MRLRLRTKFAALVLGLILLMMGSVWYLIVSEESEMEESFSNQQRLTMRDELHKRAGGIFAFLAANSEALAVGDYLTVDAFVRDISREPDILFVQIVRNGRQVVPLPERGEPPVFTPPPGIDPAGDSFQVGTVIAESGENILVASGPIIDKTIGVRVADAYIGISKKPIEDAISDAQEMVRAVGKNARHNMTFTTIVLSLIGIVCALLMVHYVVRPIRTLARGARIIGEGNLDHQVSVSTNDEVGELAKTFNEMTRNLKADQVELVEKKKFEQELKIAMEIQKTLLPKELPRAPGYDFGAVFSAAREVSGDYYDFLTVQANGHARIGVVMADVSGKGVPGAFMMAVTRSILRAKATGSVNPSDVLRATDAVLRPDIKRGMFVSMFYGLLDPSTARISFSNAGHNPSLVYRASSGAVDSIRCKGMAFGIGTARQFESLISTREIGLDPGDIFFQYTDGVQHAMNAAGERFGMDRLMDIFRVHADLPAQSIVGRILEIVGAFTSAEAQFDDITMVAIKRTSVSVIPAKAGIQHGVNSVGHPDIAKQTGFPLSRE
ncbi:SpoIIE family protein phosphatase [bacterium]|nr:SpoIIE family protein phosphatase [bacterium]